MTDTDQHAPVEPTGPEDRLVPILAACWAAFAGSILFNFLPIYLGAAAIRFSLAEQEAGALGALMLLGLGLASVSAPFWIRRVNAPRFCAATLLLSALLLGLSSFMPNKVMFASTVSLSSAFGGAAYACAIDALSHTRRKERSFACVILVIQGTSGLTAFALSKAPAFTSFVGLTSLLAALTVAAAAFALFITNPSRVDAKAAKQLNLPDDRRPSIFKATNAFLALIALALFGTGVVGVWAFLERIAASSGLAGDNIYIVLSQGYLAGAVGGLAAGLIGERGGRVLPLIAVSALLIATLTLAPNSISAGLFLPIALAFQFSWNFLVPYQLTIISNADSTDRLFVLNPAFQALGAVAGPAVAGAVAFGGNFTPVLIVGAVLAACSAVLFLIVDWASKRQTPDQVPVYRAAE